MRRGQLHEAEGREDVELIGALEIAHRHVERLGPAAARIVHQQGQLAEGRDDGLDGGDALGFIGDVAGQADGVSARADHAVRHGQGPGRVQIGDGHRGARRGEGLSDGAADARPCARHQGDLSVQSKMRVHRLRRLLLFVAFSQQAWIGCARFHSQGNGMTFAPG